MIDTILLANLDTLEVGIEQKKTAILNLQKLVDYYDNLLDDLGGQEGYEGMQCEIGTNTKNRQECVDQITTLETQIQELEQVRQEKKEILNS